MNDPKSTAGNYERPNNRVRVTHPSKESSTTTFSAACSALLTERENYKNCFEDLTIKKQCLSGLVAKTKELEDKLVDREKTDSASKTTLKGHKKRATASDKRVATLEIKLANDKALDL